MKLTSGTHFHMAGILLAGTKKPEKRKSTVRIGMTSWFDCSKFLETAETAMKIAAEVKMHRPETTPNISTPHASPYI